MVEPAEQYRRWLVRTVVEQRMMIIHERITSFLKHFHNVQPPERGAFAIKAVVNLESRSGEFVKAFTVSNDPIGVFNEWLDRMAKAFEPYWEHVDEFRFLVTQADYLYEPDWPFESPPNNDPP